MKIESFKLHAQAAIDEYRTTDINVRIAEGLVLSAGVVVMFNNPESTDFCTGQQRATLTDYACTAAESLHELPIMADTRSLVRSIPHMQYRAELKAYLAASDRTDLTATQSLGNPYGIEAPQMNAVASTDHYLEARQNEEFTYDALGYGTYLGSGALAAALPGVLLFVAGRYAWRRQRNKLRVRQPFMPFNQAAK